MKGNRNFDEEYKNDDREIPNGDTRMENFVVLIAILMFLILPLLAFIFG